MESLLQNQEEQATHKHQALEARNQDKQLQIESLKNEEKCYEHEKEHNTEKTSMHIDKGQIPIRITLHKCDVCGETFNSNPTLVNHKSDNHNPNTRTVCNFCNSQENDLKGLQKHIRVQHIVKQKMECLQLNSEILALKI